ncbi:MAG: response regulator transcription factor [Sedimentisphaerales bacterium]|nr:response regulator transcription factor [Sedimentisphaerales bacterium]
MVRIILVDDHRIIRQGLRSLLESQSDIEVIGEAENGHTAVQLVHEKQPDIVITDVTMPHLNGIEATSQITRLFPQVKVIALSGHSDNAFVTDMLKAGASAYVLKKCLFEELLGAIRIVNKGGRYLSPEVTKGIVGNYICLLSESKDKPLEKLTEREREVLQLIAEGKSTKQIALQLHVSAKAIEANRRKVMQKLNSQSIAELVKYAIAGGLISLE